MSPGGLNCQPVTRGRRSATFQARGIAVAVNTSASGIVLIVAIVVAAILPRILKISRARKPPPPPPAPRAEKTSPVQQGESSAAANQTAASAEAGIETPATPPVEPLAVVLLRIGAKLENIADRSAHPSEFKDWPTFQEVVTVFR